MALSIEKIESVEEFRGLKNIWDEVLDGKKPYHPFLDYDWFELWLDNFIKEKEKLLILLVKQNNSIKAICPFQVKKEKFKGVNVRKIELIGNIYSPIRNIIFADLCNEEKEEVLLGLFNFLNNSGDWDLIDLNSLPEEDFDFKTTSKVMDELGLRNIEYFCFQNWYLDQITYSSQEYLKNRPNIIRKDVPYCQRRLQKMGRLEFKLFESDDGSNQYMNLYYDVYSKSWQQKEDVGPNFHRDLAEIAGQKNMLRLGFLFLNDAAISSQFWIVCNKTAYILKTVYDQNQNKFSPGKILTLLMINHVIDVDKVTQIDFLHGDDPYKKDWAPKCRNRRGIIIFNNTAKGMGLSLLALKILPMFERSPLLKGIRRKVGNLVRKTSQQTTDAPE